MVSQDSVTVTWKFLFVDPECVESQWVASAIAGLPIRVVWQRGLEKMYFLDSGIPAEERFPALYPQI